MQLTIQVKENRDGLIVVELRFLYCFVIIICVHNGTCSRTRRHALSPLSLLRTNDLLHCKAVFIDVLQNAYVYNAVVLLFSNPRVQVYMCVYALK